MAGPSSNIESAQAKRHQRLMQEDAQFRDSIALESVTNAKRQPGLRLAEVVKIVMEGYADRPALGQRAREIVTDPSTGRKTARLLPRFDTLTYRELWTRAQAIAGAWHHDQNLPVKAGDAVCILGFTSPDYATLLLANIHLGAVNVPLQTSAPPRQHADIMAETEVRVLATSIDYLDAAIEAILLDFKPQRLVVFEYDERDDDQRERLENARKRLSENKVAIAVDTLNDLIAKGKKLDPAPLYIPPANEDPLAWLFYTSGSTGTPKGAIFTQSLVIGTWLSEFKVPAITLSFMPMAHLVGNGYLLLSLANGGTSYCAPKADLSTLFEDLPLVRPTMASLVPRVCELFQQKYLSDVDRRIARGEDEKSAEEEAKTEMRETLLGGRLMSVGCGSASLSPETYAFMESMLGMHMPIGYSSTEIAGGTVLVDWKIMRPPHGPVLDYKLADVPELGYFNTDKPHPRGELLVKTDRKMGGYYKRPDLTAERYDDGYYRTGDIMAELGPDNLIYLDRVNNVTKLSQGEFVAVSKLEALYTHAPLIHQIYLYANSERAYMLAVIVPADELAQHADAKRALRRAMQTIADENGLNSYEIPRDFIIEPTPFSLKNGLLSEIGKHQRPKLKARYGEALEKMFAQHAQDQINEMRALRTGGADRPVLETVSRALQASLGISASDIRPDARFAELGGDSLSALSFSTLLQEIFNVEVPVGVIINPAGDVQSIAKHIETERNSGAKRASFSKVHGAGAVKTVHARDLTLDKFIDAETLANAKNLPKPSGEIKTVLLTGATGFLGRFQLLAWLERGINVITIARGANTADARARIDAALDTDPTLTKHFRALAAEHLEVLPGDIGAANLGLDEKTFARLANNVDVIVHPAAHVNHVLPYNQLFAANVSGTAELIRLALTSKLKRFHYVSTLGVNGIAKNFVQEDDDIRQAIPSADINDAHYANGYGISKWASEVLLREAHDLYALPIDIYRPGMILAHAHYRGQLNVPDMFTRLLFSLATTGIAPATFYAESIDGGRPAARYDGISVDALANAATAIGAANTSGFHAYNMASPNQASASLDSIVDWMIESGVRIERIDLYSAWLKRFETAMHALPEDKRAESLLAILGPYRAPQHAGTTSPLTAHRFHAATKTAGATIAPLNKPLIQKYVADLRALNLI